MNIGIINYGMGNIQSVYNAFKYHKVEASVTKLEDIEKFDSLVLPGVGAFKDTAALLNPYKKNIKRFISSGKPFLGICVGLQYLYEMSFENGKWEGLGYFKGVVKKLPEVKLPQVGWNNLIVKGKTPILKNIPSASYVYYINSYAADKKNAFATSFYGTEFAAVVGKKNVFGTQFHPEKSGKIGLKILKNFIEVTKNCL
ncbi:MAG: imidazole glycerol phosphate synthase subunit HisH [Thermoplasmatales archaeon]|nr:MAG: imidazole glycerol phosphate synthase subunit HisH [Thermoplasmatales archaeon]